MNIGMNPNGELVQSAVNAPNVIEIPDSFLDEAARFRTTCLIETDVPYIEETWAGRTMALGDRWVRIGAPIPRCAVMDLDPVTGERNARLLKALAGYRPKNEAGEPVFGVYARIVGGRE